MDFALINRTLTKPLCLGCKGPEVKLLQHALIDWDEYNVWKPLKVDGHFGKATHKFVTFVQYSENLKQDGVVGPKTAEKLGLEMGPNSAGSPVIIRFEEPPRPPMTPPLQMLVDVIIDGLKPLQDAWQEAILNTPHDSAKGMLARRKWSSEHWDDLVEELGKWSSELPTGNLAAASLRVAFQSYIKWMRGEVKALEYHARGGYYWRFDPLFDQIPVDSIVGISERVLRGEQSVTIAIAQMRLALDQFNMKLKQMPHTDANGVAY